MNHVDADDPVGRCDRPNWTGRVQRYDARTFVTPAALAQAAILSRASGSGSEGWNTRLGKLLAKWTMCSPESLAISRMTPVVGRTSRRTSRMKTRLRSVAGAYWRTSLIKLTRFENFGPRVADASVDVASVQRSALGHARAVLRALAKMKTARRRPWQGMKSASPYARADARAPKGECPIYPSHARFPRSRRSVAAEKWQGRAARACHSFSSIQSHSGFYLKPRFLERRLAVENNLEH
jgi:hypothetical protein